MHDDPPLSCESRMLLILVEDDFRDATDFCGYEVDLILRAFDIPEPHVQAFLDKLGITNERIKQDVEKMLTSFQEMDRQSSARIVNRFRNRMPLESLSKTTRQKARVLAKSANATFVTPSHLVGATLLRMIEDQPKSTYMSEQSGWLSTAIYKALGVAHDEEGGNTSDTGNS